MGANPLGRGVSWHSRYGRYVASISVGGRKKHLGYFDSPAEAAQAYAAARRRSPKQAQRKGWGNAQALREALEPFGDRVPPIGFAMTMPDDLQRFTVLRAEQRAPRKGGKVLAVVVWGGHCRHCGAAFEQDFLPWNTGLLRNCAAHRGAGAPAKVPRPGATVADGSISVLRRGPVYANEPVFGGKPLSQIGDEDDALLTPAQQKVYERFMMFDKGQQYDKAKATLGLDSRARLPEDWLQRMPPGWEDELVEGLV